MVKSFLVYTASDAEYELLDATLRSVGCVGEKAHRDNREATVFDPERHQGLILLGEGKDFTLKKHERRFRREKESLTKAIDSQKGVLGICHGAQHLACRLGGNHLLEKHGTLTDHQYSSVEILPDGAEDPLISHLLQCPIVHQSHYYTVKLPPHAEPLVASTNKERFHYEAYRVGKVLYGLQFHPEVTIEAYRTSAMSDEPWLPLDAPDALLMRMEETGKRVIKAWVELTNEF